MHLTMKVDEAHSKLWGISWLTSPDRLKREWRPARDLIVERKGILEVEVKWEEAAEDTL